MSLRLGSAETKIQSRNELPPLGELSSECETERVIL